MRNILLSCLLLLAVLPSYSLDRELYPLIGKLNQSDILYKQLSDDISSYYRNSEQNKELRPLQIYRIIPGNEISIFALAARFNLPYESITTLNRIGSPKLIEAGSEVLIPNTPGIFVLRKPESDIEYMIKSWRSIDNAIKVIIRDKIETIFDFIPGEKFHKVERSFFLGLMFRYPLPLGIISSYFGERINPITGQGQIHNGIDIAAPMGTEVMAARAGIISSLGYNDICGNFINIRHESNYETIYCHLKNTYVQLNQRVLSGMIIATVGSSGMSTGPHLHFEIRNLGKPRDPNLLITGNN
jgi:murein DD-endopeptidase MepM/ murein hydrolase activator NlpD